MPRSTPQHVRVFLASPGDVAEERREVVRILSALPSHPLVKGALTIEIDAWSPEQTPMEANADGQESVVKYVGRPSACDLTVIILWSRLGTPLPAEKAKPDGSRYRSGTEWEFEDARRAKKPVFLYVRTQPPPAPRTDEERQQRAELAAFLAGLQGEDGSIRAARNDYDTVERFAELFERHMEAFVARRIGRRRLLAWVPALAIATAAGFGVGAWAYLHRTHVTLDTVEKGLLSPADRQVTLWISYATAEVGSEDRVWAQIAEERDPAFRGPLLLDAEVERESQKRLLVVVPLDEARPVEGRWRAWMRVIVKRRGDVVAASPVRELEATAR